MIWSIVPDYPHLTLGGGYSALYVFNRGDIMLCTLHNIGDLLTNGFNDIAHGLKKIDIQYYPSLLSFLKILFKAGRQLIYKEAR